MSYRFVKAGLLDIPLIFELIFEGTYLRVFSDSFFSGTGQLKLFWRLIMIALLAKLPLVFRKRCQFSLEVFYIDTIAIGFILLSSESRGVLIEQELSMCAIVPAFRNRGHGKAMIRMLIERLPAGMILTAYCTKSAKTMQYILKRLQFKPDKTLISPGIITLQFYRYVQNTKAK